MKTLIILGIIFSVGCAIHMSISRQKQKRREIGPKYMPTEIFITQLELIWNEIHSIESERDYERVSSDISCRS